MESDNADDGEPVEDDGEPAEDGGDIGSVVAETAGDDALSVVQIIDTGRAGETK